MIVGIYDDCWRQFVGNECSWRVLIESKMKRNMCCSSFDIKSAVMCNRDGEEMQCV
jgi:hypothetical protein